GRGLLVAALAGVLVVGITAPQWTASFDVMRQATRAKLSYAVAGENSYFPLSAILWLFPFFFGSRWPNIYPQTWWGPWHLCETLGYVGLVTLVLAIVTVWKFRKWKKSTHKLVFYKNSLEGATVLRTPHFALVRTWFWICLGAGVFMLGYYLPTYWLICQLPVLGWVRCPSRMILVVGCGLATLAAVGVDFCMTQPAESVGEFSRCVRRACRRRLPIVMIASLIVLAVLAILAGLIWPDAYPWPMNGSWRDAIQAVLPYNPAVWIPLCLVVLTSVAVWYWLRRPAKNWPMLIALLIVDFSTVAPFVDAPAGGAPGPSDPDVSPAAAWLRDNAPKDEPYRVWGLGNPYGRRQAELLLPRTNVVQEIASISTYGPFQTPAHAGVLGFEIFGTNTDPAGLLNRPDLLAEYNVRYILVEAGGEDEKHVRRARPSAYRLVASLPAVHPGDPAIFIYENQHKAEATASGTAVGFTSPERGPVWWLWWGTLPAGGVYILALAGGIMVRLRTQKSAKPDAKQRVNRI
ncbi:MAG: hypothetical protein JW849_01600, partial [Phycisphaerae bacterium]|nr:hypothetical protein [Phycisphaerae bacterium]